MIRLTLRMCLSLHSILTSDQRYMPFCVPAQVLVLITIVIECTSIYMNMIGTRDEGEVNSDTKTLMYRRLVA